MLSAKIPDVEQRTAGNDGSCKAAYIGKSSS